MNPQNIDGIPEEADGDLDEYPGEGKTWDEVNNEDLALAADELALTIDQIQWSGEEDYQVLAARDIRELSEKLRRDCGIYIGLLEEKDLIFWKKVNGRIGGSIHDTKLKAHQVARCSDAHLRMIRGTTNLTISRIRSALQEIQLDPEPDPRQGIYFAKLQGIAAGKELQHCAYPLYEVTVGEVMQQGVVEILRQHPFGRHGPSKAKGRAYLQMLYDKMEKLS